ncbi:unnamed protein product [Ectocarpus sp. 4 AP-2014]
MMGSMGRFGTLGAGLAAFVLGNGVIAFSPSYIPGHSGPGPTARSPLSSRRCGSRSSAKTRPSASTARVDFGWVDHDHRPEGRKRRFQLRAASAAVPPEAALSGTAGDGAEADKSVIGAVYRFTRPHTIKGTILASVTGVARALIESPNAISLDLVPKAVLGLLSLLLGNAFIVGINQIYDVDIDKAS